ncbi:ATP synthase D chain, mitochondrial [Hordeum vulgare]|nr:ATP synthase D chain, mitochondrial [Hordeum vulgare]
MLAGCSLSSRHQMSTAQRLPCGFSKRGGRGDATGAGAAPRVVPGGDGRGGNGTCSFRAHPAPPVTQAVSWGAKPEPSVGDGGWEVRSRAVKRAHEEEAAAEEYGAPVVRAKRTRMGGDGDEVWFHQSIAGTAAVMQVAAGEGGEEEVAEEERKVFLVPSAAAFPHGMVAAAGPSSLAAAKQEEYSKSPSHSSSSSGTDGGSSAMLPLDPAGVRSFVVPEAEREALELVGALTACAEALAGCQHDAANYYLARLGETASPSGPTPLHRVAAYFAEALALRAANMWPHVFDVTPPRELTDGAFHDDDDALALRVLNSVTPIPRFLHFTLNERLIRAFDGHDRVHIIDFDIKQGLQWPSLLQSLAARRPEPPAHVRITGVGSSRQELQDTGARLAHVAAGLGLAFEFHAVVDRLEDVRLWMLHVKRGERVAVNCILAAHRLLRDETGGALSDFLGLVRSTGASVLLLGEHEAAGLNGGRWEARFARALQHYAAAFDAVGAAGLPPASAARAKAEEMFAREIRNAVAFEGPDRSERHESFAGWRRRMEDGGFRNAGIGDREAMQGRMIARMFAPGKYGVHPQGDGEGLTLRWLDSPLYTVTAWTPTGDGAAVSASTTASHSLQS